MGATRGTQYAQFQPNKPKFGHFQKVRYLNREKPYTVTSIQKVQIWWVYELKEIDGVYIKEEKLTAYEEEAV